MAINQFLDAVTSQIRSKEAKSYVNAEISQHVANAKKAWMKKGFNESEAEAKAVQEMGSPVILGQSLNQLHKPKIDWLLVTGLDLKKEVIDECNRIAQDLQYDDLEFLVGDINDYNEETAVDMVVTLHACDVATDMALARAVRFNGEGCDRHPVLRT